MDALNNKTLDNMTLQNGFDVWFASYGSPHALNTFVLVHGGAGSHLDFQYLSPHLVQDNVNVVAVDLPGNGLTSANAAGGIDLTENRIVDALVELIDAMRKRDPQRRIFLVGHSLGGMTAMQVAAKPSMNEALAGLALLNSGGFRPHVGGRPYWLVRLLYRSLVVSSFVRVVMSFVVHFVLVYVMGFAASKTKDEAVFTFHRGGTLDFSRIKSSAQAISKSTLPTFLATALNDRIIEKEISDEVCAVLKPAVRIEYPSGGHNIQKTRATDLAAALVSWANSIPPVHQRSS
ncbi:hypothetical protein LEN26_011350 [Aphanomyces euteiches]|nr:hypothetical protein AeMF1_017951 [Aphanomyces euteiches]KAH9119948.1 hypothetical protein LEN26_011350 [Aphanomyces euteiches]KAH9189661.1 hypothetical protein AeNC1_008362 [Aphanomyces euteiches]